ncbi:HlyC/CorC family transporter [Magnetovirga frankeli]|uniref:hemolysin family protein n=1 Tax=Magnetovirga frankeli TaxID=947516 RepID=UPI001292FA5A|nr:HlyC/CorC family transporter [gamma proteobacterium SS-5]
MNELFAFYHSLGISPEELELGLRVLFQVLLLTSSAVFSGSETALFSLSRIDLQRLRQTRNRYSESVHAMLDEPRRLIISILCGNELVNIASAVNMTGILLLLYGSEDTVWINILVMVPLLLLIGEVTPKTIAVNYPLEFTTRLSARILPRWIILITPLREAVRMVADRITTWLVGEGVSRQNILKPDEFRTLLEEGEETGVIDATERVLIGNLLEATETDISRIMTPGPRIRFLDADLPVPEMIERFREYCHPRVPVYQGHWDNVIGFIHSEQILKLVRGGGDLSQVTLEMILKPAHFVPPTKKVDEMFDYFQAHNTRIAIVLGEYGEVLGLVTLKDVLTFIFGEISGKMEEEDYSTGEEGGWLVPGDMRLGDFYNLANIDLDDPVMATVGGVAFRLFDRLPREGDREVHEGCEFIVKEVQGLRISQLLIRKVTKEGVDEEAPAADGADADETALATAETANETPSEPPNTPPGEQEKI